MAPTLRAQIAVFVAAIALFFVPFSAHANTRAGDYSVCCGGAAAGATLEGSVDQSWFAEDTDRGALWLALLGGVGVIIGILIIQEDGDQEQRGDGGLNQSPGAN